MEFNLQTFLQDMDRRAEERHKRLEDKVDSCLMTVADHETRVSVIEQTPPADHEARLIKAEGVIKQLKWVVVTVVGGGVTGYLATLFSRLSKGL